MKNCHNLWFTYCQSDKVTSLWCLFLIFIARNSLVNIPIMIIHRNYKQTTKSGMQIEMALVHYYILKMEIISVFVFDTFCHIVFFISLFTKCVQYHKSTTTHCCKVRTHTHIYIMSMNGVFTHSDRLTHRRAIVAVECYTFNKINTQLKTKNTIERISSH